MFWHNGHIRQTLVASLTGLTTFTYWLASRDTKFKATLEGWQRLSSCQQDRWAAKKLGLREQILMCSVLSFELFERTQAHSPHAPRSPGEGLIGSLTSPTSLRRSHWNLFAGRNIPSGTSDISPFLPTPEELIHSPTSLRCFVHVVLFARTPGPNIAEFRSSVLPGKRASRASRFTPGIASIIRRPVIRQ